MCEKLDISQFNWDVEGIITCLERLQTQNAVTLQSCKCHPVTIADGSFTCENCNSRRTFTISRRDNLPKLDAIFDNLLEIERKKTEDEINLRTKQIVRYFDAVKKIKNGGNNDKKRIRVECNNSCD